MTEQEIHRALAAAAQRYLTIYLNGGPAYAAAIALNVPLNALEGEPWAIAALADESWKDLTATTDQHLQNGRDIA